MLIEQDRSKPIAHAVKLLVLIKTNKGRCFPCTLISETAAASPLKDKTRKGLGVLSRLPRHRCEHTHLCRYSNTPTQVLSNPYTWPRNKGRNTIYFIHISIHIYFPCKDFSGHISKWTEAADFPFLERKQD